MKPPQRLLRFVSIAGLLLTSCRQSQPEAEVVAQGIDDDRIYLVLKESSITKPVRAVVSPDGVHFYANQEAPAGLARIAASDTNDAEGTITISVEHRIAATNSAGFHIFLDGKSLGDWRFSK